MKDILLSLPLTHFYLMFVAVLLIGAFWPREPSGLRPVAPLTVRQKSCVPYCKLPRPFTRLQATLSASYTDRMEKAIRMIRGR
jgi:hypothetical protein